jgi:ubiquitin-conjugating enzyme E2 Z
MPAGANGAESASHAAMLKHLAAHSKSKSSIEKLLGYGFGPGKLLAHWDPSLEEDGDKTEVLPQTMLRIRKDLKEFFTDPIPEVFLVPDTDNVCIAHAIVMGPRDTPYEGGFFYFYVKFPADYPIKPPRIKLMTTGGDNVRFNPNLYRNGKVCLSILGTWNGPGWSPANNLSSVLLSIQSLMNEKPYHNEPGFEENGGIRYAMGKKTPKENPVDQYNNIIRHETIRVAVFGMLEEAGNLDTRLMPSALREKIIESFRKKIPHYESVISSNMPLHGKDMKDPFGEPRGKFDYIGLQKKLSEFRTKYPPDEDAAMFGGVKEYNSIAAAHSCADEPNMPNAAARKEVDSQAAIDDANYYLDEEGTSGEEEEDEDMEFDDEV